MTPLRLHQAQAPLEIFWQMERQGDFPGAGFRPGGDGNRDGGNWSGFGRPLFGLTFSGGLAGRVLQVFEVSHDGYLSSAG